MLLAAGFTALAIYGSLVPLAWRTLTVAEAVERFGSLNWRLSFESRTDWATNVLLFVPIGFCWLAALACDRSGWWRAGTGALGVIVASGLLSVAIEFAQNWFPPRVPSPNDITAESLGAALGAGLWLARGQAVTRWLRSFNTPDRPAGRYERLLQAYLIGFVIYSLLPFDLTVRPAEIWQKYREGKICLVPFAHIRLDAMGWYNLASDVLLYIPIGAAAATLGTGHREPVRGLGRSLAWGMVIACGIEAGQLFVMSRYTDVTQLITAAVGIALGAVAGRRWLSPIEERNREVRWRSPAAKCLWPTAAFVYAAMLVVFFWAPFHWTSDASLIQSRRSAFFEAPFSNLFWGTELNAATQIVRKGLMFGLLGAMLPHIAAAWSASMAAYCRLLAALLIGVAVFALAIEIGQIWLVDATPSFSDTLLYSGGTLAGVYLAGKSRPTNRAGRSI